MKNEFNFLKYSLLSCFFILILAASFNFIIDPYSIFDTWLIDGINSSKYGAGNRTSISKTYMVANYNPETIILGTSRFDIGIDPASPAVPDRYKPVFNFGVPGASLYNQFRNLQHAISFHKPKLVIFELGFQSFLKRTDVEKEYPPKGLEFEDRLSVKYDGSENEHRPLKVLKDYSAALLTNTAVIDSVNTIWEGKNIWLNQNGLSNGSLRFGSQVANKGYFSVFRDVLKRQVSFYTGEMTPDNNALRVIVDVIDLCANNCIDVKFIIPPYHSSQLDMWKSLGLWGKFMEFKRTASKTINSHKNNDCIKVDLYDFAFHNEITTEAIPPYGNKEVTMNWFWEPIHFKKKLGNLMLKRLFKDMNYSPNNNFGIKLTSKNIEFHIKKITEASKLNKNNPFYNKKDNLMNIVSQ